MVCISWIAVPMRHHHGQAQLRSTHVADLAAANSPYSDELVAIPSTVPMATDSSQSSALYRMGLSGVVPEQTQS